MTARQLGLDIVDTSSFDDHHAYSQGDIDILRLKAEEFGARLLTTTKDFVRLPPDLQDEVIVLPVKVEFESAASAEKIVKLCLT